MGSITDSIADDYREKDRIAHQKRLEEEKVARDNAFKAMLTDDFASAAMKGLLSGGAPVSYDTAHQAYQMSKFMIEVRKNYVSEY